MNLTRVFYWDLYLLSKPIDNILSSYHKLSPGKGQPKLRNSLHLRTGQWARLWSILIKDWFEDPSPLWAMPSLGSWSSMHKKAKKEALGSKPISSVFSMASSAVPASLVFSWPLVLTSLNVGLWHRRINKINLFFPRCFWSWIFITVTKTKLEQ